VSFWTCKVVFSYVLSMWWSTLDNLCRGSFQPFCRSLPDDPLLECFEPTDESNIQGYKFLFSSLLVPWEKIKLLWFIEKMCIVLFSFCFSDEVHSKINFICYLVTLPISILSYFNFFHWVAILYKLLELSWFRQILFYTSVCEAYAEAVKRAVVDHHTVWRGYWILCSSFILFSVISCHFFLIYGTWDSNYLDIAIASLGFSF